MSLAAISIEGIKIMCKQMDVIRVLSATFLLGASAFAQQRMPTAPQPQRNPTEQVPMTSLPTPTVTPSFGFPENLETPPEKLLPMLGYGPSSCFPLTPLTCFDVGYKCYANGLYLDALAFADHGVKMSNHARLYLLKAVCEMHLGRCEAAMDSLRKYRSAMMIPTEMYGLASAQTRINDPMRVRLEFLLMEPTW